jgi:hypothetical protein
MSRPCQHRASGRGPEAAARANSCLRVNSHETVWFLRKMSALLKSVLRTLLGKKTEESAPRS